MSSSICYLHPNFIFPLLFHILEQIGTNLGKTIALFLEKEKNIHSCISLPLLILVQFQPAVLITTFNQISR